jgi:membrane protein YdbS with pleckstrin-like domain
MSVLRSPVFIICLVLFIIHQVLQKVYGQHYPLIDNYLDNLLAMPVILTLFLAERIVLFKKEKNYRLPPADIIIATGYIILITEIIFPS